MIYEFPLNETTRRLLRIERLVDEMLALMTLDSKEASTASLRLLLDTLNFITKNDLKISIMRALDDFIQNDLLSDEVKENARSHKVELSHQSVRIFDSLRENTFLNSLRHRVHVPGGMTDFDLPILHNWLQKPHKERYTHFMEWFSTLNHLVGTIRFTLEVVRSLKEQLECTFTRGFYFSNTRHEGSLLRLKINEPDVFPEFSGNRHQISIRLLKQESPWVKAEQLLEDCTYFIAICNG